MHTTYPETSLSGLGDPGNSAFVDASWNFHCEERSRGSMIRALSVLVRHDRQIGPLEATRPYIVPLQRTGLCRVHPD